MSVYKFLSEEEKIIKVSLNSYKDAKEYAKSNGLISLTMEYEDFIRAFDYKINKFKEHFKYSELLEKAEQAKTGNTMGGYSSIASNDFMKRIVIMPLQYIKDWLDGKNNLEWLMDYIQN